MRLLRQRLFPARHIQATHRLSRLAVPAFAGFLGLAFLAPLAGAAPCVVSDNGSGTVDLPPTNCGYVSPADVHQIIDGLPPGTTVNIGIEHSKFFNVTSTNPGGNLGGEKENFGSSLTMHLQGTGGLSGYTRDLIMLAQCETHIGPRTPGNPVQSFPTDMFMLQGQITGDPDFDLLRITAGSGFGLPSPGHTTLTQQPGNTWAVDSFFDITYRIDFIGHPGSPFSGRSGSTTGTIRMQAGSGGTVATTRSTWSEVKRAYLEP